MFGSSLPSMLTDLIEMSPDIQDIGLRCQVGRLGGETTGDKIVTIDEAKIFSFSHLCSISLDGWNFVNLWTHLMGLSDRMSFDDRPVAVSISHYTPSEEKETDDDDLVFPFRRVASALLGIMHLRLSCVQFSCTLFGILEDHHNFSNLAPLVLNNISSVLINEVFTHTPSLVPHLIDYRALLHGGGHYTELGRIPLGI
jgi:hypothetical protein